jgi:hypothetical protein
MYTPRRNIIAGFLGIASFLSACEGSFAVSQQNGGVAETKIVMTLGMAESEVTRHSAGRVIFTEVMPNGMHSEFHETFPHELAYLHPVRGFSISGMQSIAMTIENGTLNYVDDRPSSGMMSLDAGLQWCEKTAAIIDKAGWTRDKDPRMVFYSGQTGRGYESIEAVRAAFAAHTAGPLLKNVRMVSWKNDKEVISLDLARKRYKDSAPGDFALKNEFIVTISIHDDLFAPP